MNNVQYNHVVGKCSFSGGQFFAGGISSVLPRQPPETVNLTVKMNTTKREIQRAQLELYFLGCVS